MKRENQIGCRVSFPSSFFMELEDVWKHADGGCHRAQPFQDFLNMLVGYGIESYRDRLRPAVDEAPPVPDEGPDPADDEAWDLPRNNRRPLLRFPKEG
ncbi:hypothetical protein AGMMS49944_24080 [Spirochaetia bacterium]|nr:hypothetical protein AGMMS49944_24080 [Spirochaetia bacterium]